MKVLTFKQKVAAFAEAHGLPTSGVKLSGVPGKCFTATFTDGTILVGGYHTQDFFEQKKNSAS